VEPPRRIQIDPDPFLRRINAAASGDEAKLAEGRPKRPDKIVENCIDRSLGVAGPRIEHPPAPSLDADRRGCRTASSFGNSNGGPVHASPAPLIV